MIKHTCIIYSVFMTYNNKPGSIEVLIEKASIAVIPNLLVLVSSFVIQEQLASPQDG